MEPNHLPLENSGVVKSQWSLFVWSYSCLRLHARCRWSNTKTLVFKLDVRRFKEDNGYMESVKMLSEGWVTRLEQTTEEENNNTFTVQLFLQCKQQQKATETTFTLTMTMKSDNNLVRSDVSVWLILYKRGMNFDMKRPKIWMVWVVSLTLLWKRHLLEVWTWCVCLLQSSSWEHVKIQ